MTSIPAQAIKDVESFPDGIIYFNAGTPMCRETSLKAEKIIGQVFPDVAITQIFLGDRGVFHICTITFARDDADKVHDKLESLGQVLRAAGMPPYRSGSANSREWPSLQKQKRETLLSLINSLP